MANTKITTIEELERLMKGSTAAMSSVQPVRGDEKFIFHTRRHSPNCKVEPSVAEAFIEKYKDTDKLKVIGWNKTSTTIYVLR